MKNWFLAAVLAAFSALALAQSPPPAARGSADESAVRTRVEQRFNAKPDSATRMPFGLWEIVIGTEVFYVDTEVNYAFVGRVLDAKTRDDLTAKKRDELLRVDFKTLPLDQAVKIVRGDGSRKLVTFEDPNCGYCKKLYRDIAGLKNVTIYTFLYPILSPDSTEKSKAIWCSADRVKAWNDWMVNGVSPTGKTDCNAPIEKVVEIGQRLNIRGTPTIFLSNGSRLPGAVPLARLEQEMASAAAGK